MCPALLQVNGLNKKLEELQLNAWKQYGDPAWKHKTPLQKVEALIGVSLMVIRGELSFREIMSLVSAVISSREFPFIIIGLSLTILGGILLNWLIDQGVPLYRANLIQAILSIESNFILSNFITFKDRRNHRHIVWRMLSFHVVKYFITVPLNQWMTLQLIEGMGLSVTLGYIISTGVSMIVNWQFANRLIFRERKQTFPVDPKSEI